MAKGHTSRGDFTAEEISQLHALPDDALVNAHEAAQMLRLKYNTLTWYRYHGGGPAYVRIGLKAIRYRMRDLRAFTAGA